MPLLGIFMFGLLLETSANPEVTVGEVFKTGTALATGNVLGLAKDAWELFTREELRTVLASAEEPTAREVSLGEVIQTGTDLATGNYLGLAKDAWNLITREELRDALASAEEPAAR